MEAPKSSSYLPTLDGWRAIAICMVLLHHDPAFSLGPLSDTWLRVHGYIGVDIFFAISGLLICSRLLREEEIKGRLSLSRFYIRRAFRILPAALLFLGVVGILTLTHHLRISLREWLGSLFFLRNYPGLLKPPSPDEYLTLHFWSLSVEEHFYLILPLLLVLTRKRWRLAALGIGTALVIADRTLLGMHRPYSLLIHRSDTRLDTLLVPAAVAVLLHTSPTFRENCRRWLRAWPLLLIVIYLFAPAPEHVSALSFLVSPFLFIAIVTGAVLNSADLPGRLLEWAPLRFIGRISYSLYLWQMLFFRSAPFAGRPIYQRFPGQLIATVLCSLFSYYCIEQPMIHLGSRFAASLVPGREVETVPANPNPAI